METFVVRIWTPSERAAERPLALHGVVEHVGAAEECRFRGQDELLAALLAGLQAAPVREKEED